MTNPTYPGVYIQEVPSGVRTITAVSTSIAAFFGRTSKGSINRATRILSLLDYERTFGEPFAKSKLAKNVELFFNNGGTDCYVVRLAKNPVKAKVTLKALDGTEVLDFWAKSEGLWTSTVRMEVDYDTPTPEETFNLTVIQEDGGEEVSTETFTNLSMNAWSARYAPSFINENSDLVEVALSATDLGDPSDSTDPYHTDTFTGFSAARRPFSNTASTVVTTFKDDFFTNGMTSFQISVNESGYVTVDLSEDGDIAGADHAAIADDIAARINPKLAELSPTHVVSCSFSSNVTDVGRYLRITAASSVENVCVRVKRASTYDLAEAMMLGVDQGGVEPTRWSNFRPVPTASILRLGDPALPGGDISSMNTVAALQQDAITTITIDGVDISLTGDYSMETDPGSRWVKNEAGTSTVTGDNDGVREKLKLIVKAINAEASLSYKAELWGYQLAVIATDGSINNTPTLATTGTALGNEFIANARQYTLGTGGTGAFSANRTDGDDGEAPEYDDYIGSESLQTGFHALDPVDLFNLMILPEDEEVAESTMLSLWGPASNYCAGRRAFLLVDAPASWTDNTGRPEVVNDVTLLTQQSLI